MYHILHKVMISFVPFPFSLMKESSKSSDSNKSPGSSSNKGSKKGRRMYKSSAISSGSSTSSGSSSDTPRGTLATVSTSRETASTSSYNSSNRYSDISSKYNTYNTSNFANLKAPDADKKLQEDIDLAKLREVQDREAAKKRQEEIDLAKLREAQDREAAKKRQEVIDLAKLREAQDQEAVKKRQEVIDLVSKKATEPTSKDSTSNMFNFSYTNDAKAANTDTFGSMFGGFNDLPSMKVPTMFSFSSQEEQPVASSTTSIPRASTVPSSIPRASTTVPSSIPTVSRNYVPAASKNLSSWTNLDDDSSDDEDLSIWTK